MQTDSNQKNETIVNYNNPQEFSKLVHARRSIRQFTSEQIPEDVVNECLDLALLAPNSSNLQTWKFYKIKNPSVRARVVTACFSQPAAATSAELIACVADPSTWRAHCRQILEQSESLPGGTPKALIKYYKKLIPTLYTVGPFSFLAPLKWLLNTVVGFFKPIPREPLSSFGLTLWSVKSCALACENLMLAFRAHGYDTCPMEGYDSVRVKKALNLSRSEKLVMVIAAGRQADGGLYGPRMRFPRKQVIKIV